MKAAGIVVEYNPLHNGHLHHLEKTKQISGADCVVAIMSGHIVQRGQFSLADKFMKTKWALEAGVDLVVELPGVFTAQNADVFALRSVEILNKLHVGSIVFGSESGDLDGLNTVALLMDCEAYHEHIKTFLAQGMSYPTSSDKALSRLTDTTAHASPNNILGIQYIRAIQTLKADIRPLAIQRIGAGYHDQETSGVIQSASAIRALHAEAKPFDAYVPEYVAADLKNTKPVGWQDLYPFLAYALATYDAATLRTIFGFEEGLEHRVLNAGIPTSFDALMDAVATARYTTSRLNRCFLHALLRTPKHVVENANNDYIRVLGMRETGQRYLRHIKHHMDVPVVTKLSGERNAVLEHELVITRVYDLIKRMSLLEREFDPLITY